MISTTIAYYRTYVEFADYNENEIDNLTWNTRN